MVISLCLKKPTKHSDLTSKALNRPISILSKCGNGVIYHPQVYAVLKKYSNLHNPTGFPTTVKKSTILTRQGGNQRKY